MIKNVLQDIHDDFTTNCYEKKSNRRQKHLWTAISIRILHREPTNRSESCFWCKNYQLQEGKCLTPQLFGSNHKRRGSCSMSKKSFRFRNRSSNKMIRKCTMMKRKKDQSFLKHKPQLNRSRTYNQCYFKVKNSKKNCFRKSRFVLSRIRTNLLNLQ